MTSSDPVIQYPQLQPRFEHLAELRNRHLDVGKRVLTAGGSALYLTDHVIWAVLKRSLDLLDGIEVLVRRWNFIAAAPLIRLQIDSLLRLAYLSRCTNANEGSRAILSGQPLYKFKDSGGRTLTDARLREYAKALFPWLDNVYRETSRLIHLSEKHFQLTLEEVHPDEHAASITLRPGQPNWPPREIENFLDAMITATEALLSLIEGWIVKKDSRTD